MNKAIEPPKLMNGLGREIRYTPPISQSERLLVAAFKCSVSFENLQAAIESTRNGVQVFEDAIGDLLHGNFFMTKGDYSPAFNGIRYSLRFVGRDGVWGVRGLVILDSQEELEAGIASMSYRLQNDKIGLVAEQDSGPHQYPVFGEADSFREYKEDYQQSFVSWFKSEDSAPARAEYEANIEKWGF